MKKLIFGFIIIIAIMGMQKVAFSAVKVMCADGKQMIGFSLHAAILQCSLSGSSAISVAVGKTHDGAIGSCQ